MSVSYVIEKAASSDLATCETIMRKIYDENPNHWPYGLHAGQLKGGLYMVREASTRAPVGFVGWQEEHQGLRKVGYYSIGILPDYRRRGWAKSAVLQLLREKSAGVDEVRAMIHRTNTPSMGLAQELDIPIEKVAREQLTKAAWGGQDEDTGAMWERTPMYYGYGIEDKHYNKHMTPATQLSIIARAAELAAESGQDFQVDDLSMPDAQPYAQWQKSIAEAVAANPDWASEWPKNQVDDDSPAYVPQRYQFVAPKGENGEYDWEGADPMMRAYDEWYEGALGKPRQKAAMEKKAMNILRKGVQMMGGAKMLGVGAGLGAGNALLYDRMGYKDKPFFDSNAWDLERGGSFAKNFGIGALTPKLWKVNPALGTAELTMGTPITNAALSYVNRNMESATLEQAKATGAQTDTMKNLGLGALALGVPALGLAAYNAFKPRPEKEQGEAAQEQIMQTAQGKIRITLPTKNPNDKETEIELPFNADTINMSNALQGSLGRDIRRRLRDEAKTRIRRRGEPLYNTALHSLS